MLNMIVSNSLKTSICLAIILVHYIRIVKGANPDCALIVPPNPLTPQGLATPYILRAVNPANGPCVMTAADQQSFVEGVIFVPETRSFMIYNPLVITQNTQPAIKPTVPTFPKTAIVGLWFGTNAGSLTLIDSSNSLVQGNCVNGIDGANDIFGQFASCNGKQFFEAVQTSISQIIKENATNNPGSFFNPPVPALGTALDGKSCMTVRDFGIVDMDQSDNVVTSYIISTNKTLAGRTCQNTAANLKALGGTAQTQTLVNGSDNRLLAVAMARALNCTPYMAPDLANNGQLTQSLALDEIHAKLKQKAPIALLPKGNPMVRSNDQANLEKLNLYRAAVFQPQVSSVAFASTRLYCKHYAVVAPARIFLDKSITLKYASPDTGVANNLFTFLAQRFVNSWEGLKCGCILDMPCPITIVVDKNGVTTDASLSTMMARSVNVDSLMDQMVLEFDGYMDENNTLDVRALVSESNGVFTNNGPVYILLTIVVSIMFNLL
ncbi:predicted protein [Naegleria gruberi]|uniref:Predicted protein n=1 Tax=Naegleria gruberi TaxID=5762 RepID=D2W413_NAEGR|nr:uncharacterized protein NAEGRDRAFT_76143 [Naegleria gruberi]EFC36166.1 predicted protein [Naegleria gruberi]|eukprot:XP_002668910.1 predicted protein [Naegleria gruberi strain NEG-M]